MIVHSKTSFQNKEGLNGEICNPGDFFCKISEFLKQRLDVALENKKCLKNMNFETEKYHNSEWKY